MPQLQHVLQASCLPLAILKRMGACWAHPLATSMSLASKVVAELMSEDQPSAGGLGQLIDSRVVAPGVADAAAPCNTNGAVTVATASEKVNCSSKGFEETRKAKASCH